VLSHFEIRGYGLPINSEPDLNNPMNYNISFIFCELRNEIFRSKPAHKRFVSANAFINLRLISIPRESTPPKKSRPSDKGRDIEPFQLGSEGLFARVDYVLQRE